MPRSLLQRRRICNRSITRRRILSRGIRASLFGQKAPLKQREIWAMRIRLQLQQEARELALFNLAIDSKLRSCDLVRLRVRDICQGARVASRAIVMQRKTQRPVQFEITEATRESLSNWKREAARGPDDYLFSSRLHDSPHLSTRQYARIVHRWVQVIGLNPAAYGTHTMRRTKAALIYRRTKKPAGRAAAAEAQQAREHCQVPRHRR